MILSFLSKSKIILLIILIFNLSVYSQNRYRIKKKDKYGYINVKGEIVIKPQYKQAAQFSEGYAAVRNKKKFGYIDTMNNVIIDFKYQYAASFEDGMAKIEINNKWGLINRNGDVLIKPKYDKMWYLGQNRFVVKEFDNDTFESKKEIINQNGFKITPVKFDDVNAFSEGLCAIEIRNKDGFIDTLGNIVIEPQYINVMWEFCYGRVAVKSDENKKWGYIDKSNEVIIDFQFSHAGRFSEGIAFVKDKSGNGWFIDTMGNKLFAQVFEDAWYFSSGVCSVKKNGKWGLIDTLGNYVLKPDYNELFFHSCCGILFNHSGEGEFRRCRVYKSNGIAISEPIYSMVDCSDIEPPLIRVMLYRKQKHYHTKPSNYKTGYIDYEGNIIWKMRK